MFLRFNGEVTVMMEPLRVRALLGMCLWRASHQLLGFFKHHRKTTHTEMVGNIELWDGHLLCTWKARQPLTISWATYVVSSILLKASFGISPGKESPDPLQILHGKCCNTQEVGQSMCCPSDLHTHTYTATVSDDGTTTSGRYGIGCLSPRMLQTPPSLREFFDC